MEDTPPAETPPRQCCLANPVEGPCPFQSEINGDDSECNCCESCRQQCSDDI